VASPPALVDTTVHVEIPEDVRLSFRLAGPATRLAAYLLDTAVRAVLFWILLLAVALAAPVLNVGGASTGVLLLALFVMEWGYCFLFEALWNGQTPGKRAFALRVVKVGGTPIGFYDALVRNLLRAADALPAFYGVGLVSLLATPRLQRLGDVAAGTMVVREARHRLRRETADLEGAARLGSGDLGSSWRPAERTLDLIHAFSLRSDELSVGRAREISAILAAPLARRLDYRGGRDAEQTPDRFLLRVFGTFHRGRP
jgi:uncharacterized RDD family membrane protein YckC